VLELPKKWIPDLFPLERGGTVPQYLVYIQWFSPLSATQDGNHLMYKVSHLTEEGHPSASVIPADSILASVHLFPQVGFGQNDMLNMHSFTIMDNCWSFYVNPFSDRDSYLMFL
jgi:hypothetical protein